MADLPPSPSPHLVCPRCSKPITPGTAAQITGHPIHMRCVAQATRLESIEQQDRAGRGRQRAQAEIARAEEVMDAVRVVQTTCLACGQRLDTSRGVLFQGDQLVHAACWRADPPPPPPSPA